MELSEIIILGYEDWKVSSYVSRCWPSRTMMQLKSMIAVQILVLYHKTNWNMLQITVIRPDVLNIYDIPEQKHCPDRLVLPGPFTDLFWSKRMFTDLFWSKRIIVLAVNRYSVIYIFLSSLCARKTWTCMYIVIFVKKSNFCCSFRNLCIKFEFV